MLRRQEVCLISRGRCTNVAVVQDESILLRCGLVDDGLQGSAPPLHTHTHSSHNMDTTTHHITFCCTYLYRINTSLFQHLKDCHN
mmetsp:Transcript_9988/g.17689  ORF Transcript_9988/g.17689 Transcript_9988/m.17689 type:complete len:85 (+) Transcript_9988:378-632(+)